MRNEENVRVFGIELGQDRLRAWQFFAAMIPEDCRERAGAVGLPEKAVQFAATAGKYDLFGLYIGLGLSGRNVLNGCEQA